MAVTLKISGNGLIAGGPTNIKSYSLTEEATPIEVSDSRGSVGELSINAVESDRPDGSVLLMDDYVDLEDGSNGTTQAIVRGVSTSESDLSLNLESRLGLLTVDRQALPQNTSLGNALTYYLGLVGIVDHYLIDATIYARPVVYQGWYGNVWFYLKQICVAQGIEVALVSDNIVFRPVRGREAVVYRDSAVSLDIDNSDTARSVEVYRYTNEYRAVGLAFPPGGWTDETPVWQVDAGETQTFDVPINASLISVSQPVCVSSVVPNYSASSVYTVTDKNKNIVDPIAWNRGGGSVTVALNENTQSLTFTVHGYNDYENQPFRIAMPIGSGNETDVYSSVRVVGEGVFFDKVKHTFLASVNEDRTTQLVGATVDNPFITTIPQVQDAGARAASRWSGPAQTLAVTTVGINRVGVTGSANYYTFGDYDIDKPNILSFAHFDADAVTGTTFQSFDDYITTLTKQEFKNQAFGNVAGARRRHRFAWYRIVKATLTEDSVSYTAEEDTLFGDFDSEWPNGSTFGDFDNVWNGKAFADFSSIPLWRGQTSLNKI